MQNIKRYLSQVLVLVLIFSFQSQLFSQPQNLGKIRSQKIAFFTEKMELTEKEAAVFWPVYFEFCSQNEKINLESRNLTKSLLSDMENMSEKEIEESHQKYLALQSKSHKLFLKYDAKYMEILPVSKVMKLYIAENQFKQYLLRQIGDQRRPGPGRNR
ncbi:MAG: hypothetical protein K9H49_07160 [Bacteroidales bacterium]|nr:hypothetical protein [Bacteroidales bacterium]